MRLQSVPFLMIGLLSAVFAGKTHALNEERTQAILRAYYDFHALSIPAIPKESVPGCATSTSLPTFTLNGVSVAMTGVASAHRTPLHEINASLGGARAIDRPYDTSTIAALSTTTVIPLFLQNSKKQTPQAVKTLFQSTQAYQQLLRVLPKSEVEKLERNLQSRWELSKILKAALPVSERAEADSKLKQLNKSLDCGVLRGPQANRVAWLMDQEVARLWFLELYSKKLGSNQEEFHRAADDYSKALGKFLKDLLSSDSPPTYPYTIKALSFLNQPKDNPYWWNDLVQRRESLHDAALGKGVERGISRTRRVWLSDGVGVNEAQPNLEEYVFRPGGAGSAPHHEN